MGLEASRGGCAGSCIIEDIFFCGPERQTWEGRWRRLSAVSFLLFIETFMVLCRKQGILRIKWKLGNNSFVEMVIQNA